MPIHDEDGPPLDDRDADHDEDGNESMLAKCAQQGRSAIKSFDQRCTDLMGFKQKFGHCDVPRTKSGEYQSLGKWCSALRMSYKKIQKNETPPNKLPQENIRQLEDAGFKWSVSRSRTFDEWYAELMEYKEEFHHCNVPKSKCGGYQSLGIWCNNLRTSYKKIQKSEKPHRKLTEEHIQQLEDAGFKWSLMSQSSNVKVY